MTGSTWSPHDTAAYQKQREIDERHMDRFLAERAANINAAGPSASTTVKKTAAMPASAKKMLPAFRVPGASPSTAIAVEDNAQKKSTPQSSSTSKTASGSSNTGVRTSAHNPLGSKHVIPEEQAQRHEKTEQYLSQFTTIEEFSALTGEEILRNTALEGDEDSTVSRDKRIDFITHRIRYAQVDETRAGAEKAEVIQAIIDLWERARREAVAEAKQFLTKTSGSAMQAFPPRSKEADLKRSIIDAEIDAVELDVDYNDNIEYTQNCNQIRTKIRVLIDSGEVLVTHWLRDLGVNSNSYGRFMKLKGPWSGIDNQTFDAASRYFQKREIAKIPPPTKKRKSTDGTAAAVPAPSIPDASDITLDGELQDDVAIYDSCDEVRRKIAAHLRKEGVTSASFLREIAKMYHCEDRKFQAKQLTTFRGYKGPDTGNMNAIFYASYVYFEKLRIMEGKPKSKHRQQMESAWPGGFEHKRPGIGRRGLIMHKDHSSWTMDALGQPQIH